MPRVKARKLAAYRTLRLDDVDISTQLDLAMAYYSTLPGVSTSFRSIDDVLDYWGALRQEWYDTGKPHMFLYNPALGETEPAAERLHRQHRGG